MREISKTTDVSPSVQEEYAPRHHPHEGRILQIAARGMNVNVDNSDKEYWRMGAKFAAALDTLVDEHGYRDGTFLFDEGIAGLSADIQTIDTIQEAKLLPTFFSELPAERQEAWVKSARELAEHGDNKASALTINKLVDATLDEAESAFVGVFELDTVGRDDETAREKFNRWLTHFARTGYAVDAALDMPQDYERKIIRVKPTFRNRTEMLLAARSDMPKCFGVGHVALVEFGRTGWATIKERKR